MSDYQARIRDAHAIGLFPAGEVSQVEIEHGVGCEHHRDRSRPCSCFPLITAVVHDEVLTIGTGGAVLERRRRS